MGTQNRFIWEDRTHRTKGKMRGLVWRLMGGDGAHGIFVFSLLRDAVGSFLTAGGAGMGAGGGREGSGSTATPGSSADNGERTGKV